MTFPLTNACGGLTFTVEVEHTDRTRTPVGTFATFTTSVDVLADTDHEAQMVAAQMVDAIRHEAINGMVTATRVIACIA